MNYNFKKALVVGLGSIGRRHIRILLTLYPGIRIAVLRHKVCNKNETQDLQIQACYTKIEDVLKFKPQFAIIANPSSKHLKIASFLASAGVHLLIEKPLADESQNLSKFINLCKEKKIVLMTGYNLRFSPSLKKFRKLINEKIIGDIYSIHSEVGQYLPSWRPGTNYQNNVSAQKKLGGGVLRELSHEIDYLNWIFGPIIWVKSEVSRLSSLKIDVEDSAKIIFGVRAPNDNQISGTLSMDFIRHDTTRNCLVVGELGTLKWDGITEEVLIYRAGKKSWEVVYKLKCGSDYTYIQEIKNFIASIDSLSPPSVSGEDGLNVLLAIEAISKSSEKGSIVYL